MSDSEIVLDPYSLAEQEYFERTLEASTEASRSAIFFPLNDRSHWASPTRHLYFRNDELLDTRYAIKFAKKMSSSFEQILSENGFDVETNLKSFEEK